MRRSASFFDRTPVIPVKKREPESCFIDIGGEQFHAIAVALIDYFQNTVRVNEAALKIILDRLLRDFPHYKSNQAYLTPAERMNMLINIPRKSELVECMAYVLRQLTVDELYTHPLDYRDAFDGLSKETTKDYLRQTTTPLPSSVLDALAQTLGMTLTLSFQGPGKEIRTREIYAHHMEGKPKLEVLIQVQGSHYFPSVKNSANFSFVGQRAIHPAHPMVNSSLEHEDTVADILETIATHNRELFHAYDHCRKKLLIMVNAGELSREKLMMLYTKFLPMKHEVNQTQFFRELERQESAPVLVSSCGESEEQIVQLLVNSLAGWMCTRQVDSDLVFDDIENSPQQSAVAVL